MRFRALRLQPPLRLQKFGNGLAGIMESSKTFEVLSVIVTKFHKEGTEFTETLCELCEKLSGSLCKFLGMKNAIRLSANGIQLY